MFRFSWTLAFLFSLLIVDCSSPKTGNLSIQKSVSSIQIDSLKVADLSENMSRLSTQEDEIYLFCFLSNGHTISASHRSPLLTFTKSTRTHLLDIQFSQLQATDRLSFFLIELDEQTLSADIQKHCAEAVQQSGFPNNFDHPRLDSLIGDDDLLGMRSLSIQACHGPSTITFKGRQLFDAFEYTLHLRGN